MCFANDQVKAGATGSKWAQVVSVYHVAVLLGKLLTRLGLAFEHSVTVPAALSQVILASFVPQMVQHG